MRKGTIIYENKNMDALETILGQMIKTNDIYWFEIFAKEEDVLYAFKIKNGVVKEEYLDDYNSLIDKHKNHIVKEYAITGCNFQTILKREDN